MSMGKIQTRKILLSLLVFFAGAFSVSIANIFGGHFGVVSAIQVVALTIYLNDVLTEKNAFKANLVDLILIVIVFGLNLVFFIANDVVGNAVYVGDLTKFWDICVVSSQLLSLAALIYTLGMFVLKSKIIHIEVIDYCDKDSEKETYVETSKEDVKETVKSEEKQTEVKSIVENNVKVETPFMEEEN